MKIYPGLVLSMPHWAGMVLFQLGRDIHFANRAIIPRSDVTSYLQPTNEEFGVVTLNEYYFKRWVQGNHLLLRDSNEVGPREFVWVEERAGSSEFLSGYVIDYPILIGKVAIKIKTKGGELTVQPEVTRVFSTNIYFDPS